MKNKYTVPEVIYERERYAYGIRVFLVNEPQPKKNRVDPDDYNIHYMKMHDFLVVAFAKQHINRPEEREE